MLSEFIIIISNFLTLIFDFLIQGFKAKTTAALKALKCKRRFGLTGTALQNNLVELWSILDW